MKAHRRRKSQLLVINNLKKWFTSLFLSSAMNKLMMTIFTINVQYLHVFWNIVLHQVKNASNEKKNILKKSICYAITVNVTFYVCYICTCIIDLFCHCLSTVNRRAILIVAVVCGKQSFDRCRQINWPSYHK